jgi:hypothetical protein
MVTTLQKNVKMLQSKDSFPVMVYDKQKRNIYEIISEIQWGQTQMIYCPSSPTTIQPPLGEREI